MFLDLIAKGEKALKPLWGRRSTLALPVALTLLFLGLQLLFLSYMVLAYMPVGLEPPESTNLLEIWWKSPEHGSGIPVEFSRVNVLFAVYLWVNYRAPRRRWWKRSSTFMLVGTASLLLATQYALYRLVHVPFVSYSVQVMHLSP